MTSSLRGRTSRRTSLVLVVAITVLLSVACHAKPLDLAGDWGGAIQVPAINLRAVLHVTSDASGNLSATFDSPDQNQTGIPCSNVLLKGESFSFEIPAAHSSYQGTLSADGKAINGTWTQSGHVPLNFTREATVAGKGSAAVGNWNGGISVPGRTLRLALHVTAASSGQFTVALDSLDQGAMGIPGSDAILNGNDFSFQIPSVHGSYQGKVGADGKTIKGTWSQGTPLPLDFTKTT